MKPPRTLLIATCNKGKLGELRKLLGDIPLAIMDLGDFPSIQFVHETFETFAQNASLKATGYATQAQLLTLADDSGLEVDALGGAPGVLSARYAGDGASDQERTNKLLSELSNVPSEQRSARFVCSVAIANEEGAVVHVSSGVCEGRIAFAPRGAAGFGYDPIFIPRGFDETFAELKAEVKNKISHRGRALSGAHEFLRSLTVASNAR
jgi:XTP/dITP diphosphohydrolase